MEDTTKVDLGNNFVQPVTTTVVSVWILQRNVPPATRQTHFFPMIDANVKMDSMIRKQEKISAFHVIITVSHVLIHQINA